MPSDTTFDELRGIDWPDGFVVEYCDGGMEFLLRGTGIALIPPRDDPAGIGLFCANIPKRSRHQQHQGGRAVSLEELRAIYSIAGETLWERR